MELQASEERKRQSIILNSVLVFLFFLTLFSILIFRSLQKNRRANKIITQQKKEVELQKHLVEEKQKEILDSIHYAKRIQKALITSEKYFGKMISELKKGQK
jgi:cell division protein FtsX